MKDVLYVNTPPLVIIPSSNAANGREVDGVSGYPIPPQYETWGPCGVDESGLVTYGPRDIRFPNRIKQVPPDILGVDWRIFNESDV